jgi:uncharacterized protein YjbI with pentapeptide repeats
VRAVPARRAKPVRRAVDGPRLAASLEPVDAQSVDDGTEWRDAEIVGELAGREIVDVDFSGCVFRQVSFTGARLEEARIADCLFDSCDLSGMWLEAARLDRVELRSCRMLGWLAPLAHLADVRARDCRLDEANLRMSTGHHVQFDSCSMRAADLYQCRWESARFFDCDLTKCRFDQVDLRGARLHGSTLDDLVAADCLRGVIIDSSQLSALGYAVLGALGVTTDDDREPDDG